MTKEDFIAFIEQNVPDGMEILIEGDEGVLLPLCFEDSKVEPNDIYGEVFVIAPCYCDIHEVDVIVPGNLTEDDIDAIIQAEINTPNPDDN